MIPIPDINQKDISKSVPPNYTIKINIKEVPIIPIIGKSVRKKTIDQLYFLRFLQFLKFYTQKLMFYLIQ